MKYEGRCLCGEISYICSGEPVFQFNCHCRDCQRSTGAAYAPIMFFQRKDIHINGNLKFYESKGGSGKVISRGFCPSCGAQIVGDVEDASPLLSIRPGTLDDTDSYRPRANVYTAHAASWDAMDPTLPKFAAMPPRKGA